MRRAWLGLAMLVVAAGLGCGPQARPPNPVLEDAQDRLTAVEANVAATLAPNPADYLALAEARHAVWQIHWERSRYPAGRDKERREAAANRRSAERIEPAMLKAFQRAMDQSADPGVAARAKLRLVAVYGEKQDWDRQIAMLLQILRDHAALKAWYFGIDGTPHYYCYYTLAGAWEAKGERRLAIDALARAMIALDESQEPRARVAEMSGPLLGRLIDYDPRIVLPQYQRLLPASLNEPLGSPDTPNRTGPAPALGRILREHREKTTTRITLAVTHADENGLVVEYRVDFPDYPKLMRTWEEEERKKPHIPLGDDFSRMKPIFRLSFSVLRADEYLGVPEIAPPALGAGAHTEALVFDEAGRCSGSLVLPWSSRRLFGQGGPPSQGAAGPGREAEKVDSYLMAALQRGVPVWWPALPAETVFVEPAPIYLGRPAPATRPSATQPATVPAAELTEDAARALAARLVNEYLAGKEFKVDVDVGGIVPKPTWTKERWDNVVKKDGRWHLTWGKPAGWSASVSFKLDGSDAKVEVDFAAD